MFLSSHRQIYHIYTIECELDSETLGYIKSNDPDLTVFHVTFNGDANADFPS